jgi:hypothetical protein
VRGSQRPQRGRVCCRVQLVPGRDERQVGHTQLLEDLSCHVTSV